MDSNPQHNPQNNAQHTREVRFAVVLYGGVSLAVYLSGIVQELLHLVQASAPGGDRHGGGASRVYRKLAQLLKDGQLDVDGADEDGHVDVPSSAPVRTRFVIDIITGASAGGLNGVFLAKALVLDKNLDLITDLWLREGDIARRLHDRRATTGTTLPNPGPPASLLSGQGMLHVLLKGLDQLSQQGSGAAAADRSPNVDELDLWVTVTDLEGRPVSTSTFNPDQLGEIRESQHRATFHFRYADPAKPGEAQAVNDFLRRYDPMLAFAARCTSSFPGGFEPTRLVDLVPVMASLMPAQARKRPIQSDAWARIAGSRTPFHLGNEWADVTELDQFFTDYGTAEEGARRSFSDGSILNNQPVDLVMATLPARRHPPSLIGPLHRFRDAPDKGGCSDPYVFGRRLRSGWCVGIRSAGRRGGVVEDLLGQVHAGGEVDAVDGLYVRPEPDVEGILGGGHAEERRGQVVGLEHHQGDVAGGRRLDPGGLAGDAVPGAGAAVVGGAVTTPAGEHLVAVGIGVAGDDGKGEADGLAHDGTPRRGKRRRLRSAAMPVSCGRVDLPIPADLGYSCIWLYIRGDAGHDDAHGRPQSGCRAPDRRNRASRHAFAALRRIAP